MPYALCPMPYALCTSGTSCYARKAIVCYLAISSTQKNAFLKSLAPIVTKPIITTYSNPCRSRKFFTPPQPSPNSLARE